MTTERFRAMGCEIAVAGGSADARHEVAALFAARERVFSRFLADSELNRVNAAAGRWVTVSELFAHTLRVALQLAEQTAGLLDPTLGAAIESAGYTRDFDLLEADPAPPGPPAPGRWRAVRLLGRRLHAPGGVQLDLNGVVKALAVDDGLALLEGDAFVSAGGDLAAHGELTVELPDGEAVRLRRGALATSGTARRRWLRGGRVQHHLIDPATGRPAEAVWEQVTACGATCLAADSAARAGFLLGVAGPAWLDVRGIPARFLAADGGATVNDAWAASMQEAPACI
jgi:thiamine biosynthesis lipoprotein